VVKPDGSVDMRNVEVQVTQGDDTVVHRGIAAGETVVTDGVDKLQPGTKVTLGAPGGESGNATGGRAPREGSDGRGAGKKKT
jgi:multidrug efflux system membrane fusion protein